MNKKLKKKLNRKLVAGISAFTILLGAVSGTYYFATNNNTSASAYSIDDCMKTLTATVEWRTLEFTAFLDLHFASKKNNTYLISDAVKGFIEYKKAVSKAMQQYEIGYATTSDQAVQIDACMRIVDIKVEEAKKMLVEHIKTTSGVKHGQIMLEKYRNINGRLAELNVELGKIAGAFEGFYQKFPGYSEDCLKK